MKNSNCTERICNKNILQIKNKENFKILPHKSEKLKGSSPTTPTSYLQPTCQEEAIYDLDIELKAQVVDRLEHLIVFAVNFLKHSWD